MPKCAFCGSELLPGTGVLYVKKDGEFHYFNGSKCMKNYLKLRRNPRHVPWTAEFKRLKSGISATAAAKAEAKPGAPVPVTEKPEPGSLSKRKEKLNARHAAKKAKKGKLAAKKASKKAKGE
ncbi:MAG: hypothetical protein HY394_00065 [Candidatus Diapherotrites archaeon]|nr:hypothetical protein [Candidatus Diapherotrites archaeon]